MVQNSLRERKQHGNALLPFNIYPCCIPQDFPQVALHWQDSMEIIYIKKGRGLALLGAAAAEPISAAAGDIFIVPPGVLHGLRQWQDERMEYENIIFETDFLATAEEPYAQRYLLPLQSGRLALPACLHPGENGYVAAATCLNEADEAGRSRAPGYELALKGAMLRLLAVLLALENAPPPRTDTADTRRFKQVLALLDADPAARPTVAQAAAACSCSASHFMRWFKQVSGQSYVTFLNDRRLTAAAERLRASDDTVLSIAGQAGFDNLSNFNRQFKKRYGQTPQEYRREG